MKYKLILQLASILISICLTSSIADAKFEHLNGFFFLREPDITRALNNRLQPVAVNLGEQVQPELEPQQELLDEEMFEALGQVPFAGLALHDSEEVQLDPLQAEIPEVTLFPANNLLGLLREANPEQLPSITITIDDMVEGSLPEPSEILGAVIVYPSHNPERQFTPSSIYEYLRARYPNAFIDLVQLPR